MNIEIPQNIIDIYDELDEGELYIELLHSSKYAQYETFTNCLNYIYKYKNNFDECIKWILPNVNETCRKIIYSFLERIDLKEKIDYASIIPKPE